MEQSNEYRSDFADDYIFPNLRKNLHLRWLTRVFLRLDSARYHRLPNVSINRAFTNDASNPKKKGNHFGA